MDCGSKENGDLKMTTMMMSTTTVMMTIMSPFGLKEPF